MKKVMTPFGEMENHSTHPDAIGEETIKMENNKETRERMTWLLRMEIANNVNEGVKHWLRDKIDLELWEMTVSDTDDLFMVVDLIDRDAIPAAFEKASYLDTAVRDVIPTEVWNWMSLVRQDNELLKS